ncbi:Cytochrome P450 [Sesbania bispinosa]|nr:Cytochrome P450 [Sesbania bispinosa]
MREFHLLFLQPETHFHLLPNPTSFFSLLDTATVFCNSRRRARDRWRTVSGEDNLLLLVVGRGQGPSMADLEPEEFKPKWFMKEDVNIMRFDLRLAPFGCGRRVCPGKTMGLASIHLWLAQWLQSFKWVPSEDAPVDLSECLKLSMEMKSPHLLTCEKSIIYYP